MKIVKGQSGGEGRVNIGGKTKKEEEKKGMNEGERG